jgi:hypothetical protein
LDLYNRCLLELEELIPRYEPEISSFAKLKALICNFNSQGSIDYRDSQMAVILQFVEDYTRGLAQIKLQTIGAK